MDFKQISPSPPGLLFVMINRTDVAKRTSEGNNLIVSSANV